MSPYVSKLPTLMPFDTRGITHVYNHRPSPVTKRPSPAIIKCHYPGSHREGAAGVGDNWRVWDKRSHGLRFCYMHFGHFKALGVFIYWGLLIINIGQDGRGNQSKMVNYRCPK